jgi:sulfur-oxidizing protein SoxB
VSPHRLTLFQLNDSHGYLEPHQELFWAADHARYCMAGGYARIAALMSDARQHRSVLAFDCGDTFHGTYLPVKSKGLAMLPVMNALAFDAMTAHWEFAYGPKQLRSLKRELKYPVLAINCYEKDSGELVFAPFTILEKGGLLVGVIGIASNIVDKAMPAHFSEGLSFTLGREELAGCIRELQEERVDLIILVSHLGFPQDMRLAAEVTGADIWLSGHTHNRLSRPVYVNGASLIQSGCHGSFLGRIDLEVEIGKVRVLRHRLLSVSEDVPPHADVEELINHQMQPYREFLQREVGRTNTALNRSTVQEATMDDFLLQSLIDLTGCEVAFSNGWRYGAPVPAGPVTMNDLYNIIPMNPPVSLVKLTGQEIWAMMEVNLERTFSANPYQQMGGYVKRCLGLNLYFKMENPPGTRIQELFVQGHRLQPDRVYSAAFVTSQGVPAKYGKERADLEVRAVEAMERYLARGTVKAELRGCVVAV